MENKYLVIPTDNFEKKSSNVSFLFPLKGLCVGFKREYDLSDIPPNSYIYVNRILDTEGINYFKSLLPKMKFLKGIVFEDLGIINIIKKAGLDLTLILYATHASCSLLTVNTYLDYVDSVVLSLDITKDEVITILKGAKKNISLYIYGPIPYMYSRRTLLTNYQNNFKLNQEKIITINEQITNKNFVMIENEFGTVCFDDKKMDGREFLKEKNILFYILNLDWDEGSSLAFLENFLNYKDIPNLTSGFLRQKTIYRLIDKEKKHD